MIKKMFRNALLLSSLSLLQPALAQNLPGTAIDEATVSADARAMITLAAEAYPTLFANGSGWRLYSGYTFKYFASSGIYVGVKDGQVNLLGGPFGNTISPKGSISAVTGALNAYIAKQNANPGTGGTTADFNNLLIAKTALDLANTFTSITMDYGTSTGAVSLTTTIKLDILGAETINGTATTRMKATISSSAGSQAYDMWLDASGTFRRLALGDFVYPTEAHAQLIGPGLISGFLIALTAMDNAQVKAALAAELQNPALSTKVTQRAVGSTSVPTVELKVSGASNASVTAYISDFGSFTMMTEFRSILFTQTTFIKVTDMKLR